MSSSPSDSLCEAEAPGAGVGLRENDVIVGVAGCAVGVAAGSAVAVGVGVGSGVDVGSGAGSAVSAVGGL